MIEVWKRMVYQGEDLGDYYLVSNTGKIKGVKTGIIRKQLINSSGYCQVSVTLGANTKKKTIRVHKAVAESFLPTIKGKDVVNHKDGNKLNNHVNNLEWCTQSENMHHAVENNLLTFSSISTAVKCIETGVIFESITRAAQWCNCTLGTISDYLTQRQGNKPKHRNYAGRHPITNEKLHWCYVS